MNLYTVIDKDGKPVKVTKTQQRVYAHFPVDKWISAYESGASLATLNALERKGLLERKYDVVNPFFPRGVEFCKATKKDNNYV